MSFQAPAQVDRSMHHFCALEGCERAILPRGSDLHAKSMHAQIRTETGVDPGRSNSPHKQQQQQQRHAYGRRVAILPTVNLAHASPNISSVSGQTQEVLVPWRVEIVEPPKSTPFVTVSIFLGAPWFSVRSDSYELQSLSLIGSACLTVSWY